jgi:hypothetical protein
MPPERGCQDASAGLAGESNARMGKEGNRRQCPNLPSRSLQAELREPELAHYPAPAPFDKYPGLLHWVYASEDRYHHQEEERSCGRHDPRSEPRL